MPEADYVDVGELLIAKAGRDFTFLHPEVLDENCSILENELVLENKIHPERFSVLILPGHKTIKWSNLKKIKEFYDRGGRVIATGLLPSKSAEFGHDQDVVQIIEAMFEDKNRTASNDFAANTNAAGGLAIHLNNLDAGTLTKALDAAGDVYDVEFEGGDVLRYIHKIKDGAHIYFFANIGETPADTEVRLRGLMEIEAWDPHTGRAGHIEYTYEKQDLHDITRINLTLPPTKSVFLIGK